VKHANLVLGAVHRTVGSTRLRDALGAPVGLRGDCALEPAAFEGVLVVDAHRQTAVFHVVPPFGHLWYLDAALNREVDEVLAFVAAATRDVTDAGAGGEVLRGFYRGPTHSRRDEGVSALLCFSP
jgi:hypothetical protein